MNQTDFWHPHVPDPEWMKLVDRLCEKFCAELKRAANLQIGDWADQIKQYLTEVDKEFPGNSDAWMRGLLELVAVFLECQIDEEPEVTLSPDAFQPYFANHMQVVAAAHRRVSGELPTRIGRY